MNPLHRLLRATHAHRTHQRMALDALPLVQTSAGKRLTKILLRHHDRYLTGAIDPDVRFRDYQNHLIHVADGFWGGAPRVAHRWLDRLQKYLGAGRYPDAAHAAGVLGHYFTDVFQPLHTETSPRERILHRPIECSVEHHYESILRGWQAGEMQVLFQLSSGPAWLGEAMLHAARFAHQRRALLLDGFRIDWAAQDPRRGLHREGIEALSELFGLALTGLARVLERAAEDYEADHDPLPSVSLLLPTLLAGIDAPLQRVEGWFGRRAEVFAVAELIDEFRRTGDLAEHLPAEVDIAHRVVQVRRDEQRWNAQRERRLASLETVLRVERAPATIPLPSAAPPSRLRRRSA